jgi:hypothetical protein
MGGQIVVNRVLAARAVCVNMISVPFRPLDPAPANVTTASGLLEDDCASRPTECLSGVASFVALDVLVMASTAEGAQTAGEPVRSTWFEGHMWLDATTA